ARPPGPSTSMKETRASSATHFSTTAAPMPLLPPVTNMCSPARRPGIMIPPGKGRASRRPSSQATAARSCKGGETLPLPDPVDRHPILPAAERSELTALPIPPHTSPRRPPARREACALPCQSPWLVPNMTGKRRQARGSGGEMLRLACDVGGTFTDLVVADGAEL